MIHWRRKYRPQRYGPPREFGYLYAPDVGRDLSDVIDAIKTIRSQTWIPRELAAIDESIRLIEAAGKELAKAKHGAAFWEIPPILSKKTI